MSKPNYVYVASSWRNTTQPIVCQALERFGIDHYDFKNPSADNHGFHWSEVMPSYEKGTSQNQASDMTEYLEALKHPISEAGFASDMGALERADCTILILPCGRSAHLELGYAVGKGQRTAILLDPDEDDKVTPELMYKMVDHISFGLIDLLGWLGVED